VWKGCAESAIHLRVGISIRYRKDSRDSSTPALTGRLLQELRFVGEVMSVDSAWRLYLRALPSANQTENGSL
jgi:hypothetical protein